MVEMGGGDGEKVKGMRDRCSANYRSAGSLSFLDNLLPVGDTGIAGDCGGRTRYIAMDFSRHFSSTSIKRALMGEKGQGQRHHRRRRRVGPLIYCC